METLVRRASQVIIEDAPDPPPAPEPVRPDPMAIVALGPHYELQFPDPPFASDAGLDVYIKHRGQVAIAEHTGQLDRVLKLIKEEVAKSLNPALTFKAILAWERHYHCWKIYAQRIERIAKKLKVKHVIKPAPEPPVKAVLLAKTQGLGTAQRDQLRLAIADAERQIERAAGTETDTAYAFSRPDWLTHNQPTRVRSAPQSHADQLIERWAIDTIFLDYEAARLAHEKSKERLRVLKQDQSGDFLIAAAQAAITAAGGVEAVASACEDALRLKGQWFETWIDPDPQMGWKAIIATQGAIDELEKRIARLNPELNFARELRGELQPIQARMASLKDQAQAALVARTLANCRAAYAGSERELGELIVLANEFPRAFPAEFTRAISLANFGDAFQAEMRALLEPVT
jgi:hypothetical protein